MADDRWKQTRAHPALNAHKGNLTANFCLWLGDEEPGACGMQQSTFWARKICLGSEGVASGRGLGRRGEKENARGNRKTGAM